MGYLEKSTVILFSDIPPERLLESIAALLQLRPNGVEIDAEEIGQECFCHYAGGRWPHLSDDEGELIFKSLSGGLKRRAGGGFPEVSSVFWLLVKCGEEYLDRRGSRLMCRFEKVQGWRHLYHALGQDIITTAYLAYADLRWGTQTTDFAWESVLRTNSGELDSLLQKGVAENHFHLKGSTQSFSLTWCCLMNFPRRAARGLDEELGPYRYPTLSRGAVDNVLTSGRRAVLAAFIRALLFCAIQEPCDVGEKFLEQYNSLNAFSGAERLVERMRYLYGEQCEFPGRLRFCLDYAMKYGDFGPYRSLSGERRLLYQCFRRCFSGEANALEQNLLYLYILVKSQIRRELIQVNDKVGFRNFEIYQNRKDKLWEKLPAYCYESLHMSLNGTFASNAVRSLEARIMPKPEAERLLTAIWNTDRSKAFFDGAISRDEASGTNDLPKREEIPSAPRFAMKNFARNESFFYTIHFPKRKDTSYRQRSFPNERHHELRRENRVCAQALAASLQRSSYLQERIRAIDACSNEIGCRPEVFAPAFRFLTDLTVRKPEWKDRCFQLSLTYHAGEDFLDIADGLRAIDEAIRFLNMKRGYRIGHALALGIDPFAHYSAKAYQSVQPKQDRLDDLVWILLRGSELGVTPDTKLHVELRRQAETLLSYIYPDSSNRLLDYYHSWQLRGDDPVRYRFKRFNPRLDVLDRFSPYQINETDSQLSSYRESDKVVDYYWRYHYDGEARRRGAEIETVDISSDYMELMWQLQNKMQRFIADRGLMIECNLSSNVQIGTFQSYEQHPIFRFFNCGIVKSCEQELDFSQLNVSINTDDLGIFDTSLEFEYALLANALIYGHDRPQKSLVEAKDYLDAIRKMGLEQVFH